MSTRLVLYKDVEGVVSVSVSKFGYSGLTQPISKEVAFSCDLRL
jgi:hypothetical protein